MLAILAEDGMLVRAGALERRRAMAPHAGADTSETGDACRTLPDCDAELVLTRRCASELAAVLRGQADPLALLFPADSLADTERLYRHSPPAKTYNGADRAQ